MSNQVTPENARHFAHWVVRKLRDEGHEALWAGGCVRDQILDREPSDYDVATSAKPDEVRRCFGRNRTLAIGAAFGVITVQGRRDQGQIEIATFRCDAQYSDGRHPDHVCFSTAREDALRRDFTMNGLFYDPLERQVIDYVGGRDDLRAGIVRAIGDPYQRIAEDRLRMLRAVRFAITFGFEIDPDTLTAIGNEATHITIVSAERIATELRKMLLHPNRSHALEILRETRLLPAIMPESGVLWKPPDCTHPDADSATWENTLGLLARLAQPTFRVALAGLLWGMAQRAPEAKLADSVCARWKLSNHETKGAHWLLAHQRTLRRATTASWPTLQRLLVAPMIDELLVLTTAIAEQVDGNRQQIEYCHRKLALPKETLDPPPLITGDDLRAAGFRAGPIFRHILHDVRDAQLEARITTQEEAMQLARKIVQRQASNVS